MKISIILLAAAMIFTFVDSSGDNQTPIFYSRTNRIPYYRNQGSSLNVEEKVDEGPASSIHGKWGILTAKVSEQKEESESINRPSLVTDEDIEKIKCFGAFSFFVWYCPSHVKYQTYKLDVKYPTEQFWGRYQNEFDAFVDGGCESKEAQVEFDKCVEDGIFLSKFEEAPAVFT